MREIKFRGRDIHGNWHIGLVTHTGNAWYISNQDGAETVYEIIPETIGQYTELKDQYGNELFEDDIVQHTQHYNLARKGKSNGRIQWSKSCGAWVITDFHNNRANMYLGGTRVQN